jgi:hypothetical protein
MTRITFNSLFLLTFLGCSSPGAQAAVTVSGPSADGLSIVATVPATVGATMGRLSLQRLRCADGARIGPPVDELDLPLNEGAGHAWMGVEAGCYEVYFQPDDPASTCEAAEVRVELRPGEGSSVQLDACARIRT